MPVHITDSLATVDAAEWNALNGPAGNPFLRHAFLHALEASGCATTETGWTAQHLLLHDEQGRLRGAVPMYLKTHSFGEHVFDWAWAEAYQRGGLRYYPKLVAAVPFSPIPGPRILLADADDAAAADLLVEAALELARERQVSSLHWLFPDADNTRRLEAHGLLRRDGFQFHWFNHGYRDFDDFLAGFSAAKRKKVRQERRYVRDAGVEVEVLAGSDIKPHHWDVVYEWHMDTLRKYGSPLFLNRDFYRRIGATLADAAVLALARQGDDYVGAAFNLRGPDALYGRYWGGRDGYPALHFEVCYYSAIEYCIAHGLKRFEGGAGGEHKQARGFVPVTTWSAHWLSHPQFTTAVADFLARERHGLAHYMSELEAHTPFKQVQ